MCEYCDDKGYIDDDCGHCNGTGEGMYDGSSCSNCNGTGVEIIICDCDEGKDYEMMMELYDVSDDKYGSF